MQVSIKHLEESEERYENWHASAKRAVQLESTKGIIDTDSDISDSENLEKRKRMLQKEAIEPLNFAFERAIGKNDSVYSNFIDLLADAKKKVGRIVLKSGSTIRGYATGFMVSDRLLLTNWHVFREKSDAIDSEIQFNYEYDANGNSKTPVTFRLSPGEFFFSYEPLDYCLVAVQPLDIQRETPLSSIGYHFLNPALGKLANEGQEFVNVIHHPDGDYMQLSIRENRFVKIQEDMLWYEADTSQGSSGSPVFNDQFQVVALHHMGVAKKSADGKSYLDRDGNIIKPKNGQIDISRIHWIANEGVRISKLVAHVTAESGNDPFIKGLQTPPAKAENRPDEPEFSVQSESETPETAPRGEAIQVSIPVSALQANGVFQISLQQPVSGQQPPVVAPARVSDSARNEKELELAKIALEEAQDYSGCSGYDPTFMGQKLAFPKPSKFLQPFIARIKGSQEFELKYHHFSSIQHAVRKMPLISGINVEGDPTQRQDFSARKDNWLRDSRIDPEIQLTDAYYSRSGFDKGHMSRREDANWGATPDDARIAADLTCMYTNACPQVGKLNRSSSSGLWGKLEKVLLEKGAQAETGAEARIVVFNGPVFSANDPVYKGVQIPLEFWKLVVWRNAQQKLRATAFKLSQENLVSEINFEELDFDKNLEFKEYQLSIKALEKLTGIDFTAFRKYDTFAKKMDAKPVKLENPESLML